MDVSQRWLCCHACQPQALSHPMVSRLHAMFLIQRQVCYLLGKETGWAFLNSTTLLVAIFSTYLLLHFFFFLIFFNVYLLLRDRERQSMSMGGAKRGGDTEYEAGSRLCAVSTEHDTGLELTNREITT